MSKQIGCASSCNFPASLIQEQQHCHFGQMLASEGENYIVPVNKQIRESFNKIY